MEFTDLQRKQITASHRLFENVFTLPSGQHMPFAAYVHKHYGNPNMLGQQFLFEGEDADGVPLAQRACDGYVLRVGGVDMLSDGGGDLCASKSANGMVAVKLYASIAKLCKAQGVFVRFGTPNDSSARFYRKGTDQIVGDFCNLSFSRRELALPADAMRKLAEALGESEPTFCVTRSATCPFDDADLARINATRDGECRIVHSRESYAWVLEDYACVNGCTTPVYLSLRSKADGGLMAFLAVREFEWGWCPVIDWGVFVDRPAAAPATMELLLSALRRDCDQHVSVPMLNEASCELDVFEPIGGIVEKTPDSHFGVHVYDGASSEVAASVMDFSNWHVRALDTDYFLNHKVPCPSDEEREAEYSDESWERICRLLGGECTPDVERVIDDELLSMREFGCNDAAGSDSLAARARRKLKRILGR